VSSFLTVPYIHQHTSGLVSQRCVVMKLRIRL